MQSKIYPTQKQIQEIFRYKSGNLYYKKKSLGIRDPNKPAGFKNSNGTISISIHHKQYLRSILIWIYHMGNSLKAIDLYRRDKNKLNDKIENLCWDRGNYKIVGTNINQSD